MPDYIVRWESAAITADSAVDAAVIAAVENFLPAIARGQATTQCEFVVSGSMGDFPVNLADVDHLLSPDMLRKMFVDEHPLHRKELWMGEVQCDDTLLGYWEWVMHQIEGSQ